MKVYNRITERRSKIPLIIYPFEGIESLITREGLIKHIKLNLSQLKIPETSYYGIVFLGLS